MGNARAVSEGNVLMLGVRDLSPRQERERLEASRIRVVGWDRGEPIADVSDAIDELATRVDEIYLHVDNDALDPSVAPGASHPAPGGLAVGQLEAVIRTVASRFRVRATALTNYDPGRDDDDRTQQTGLRVIKAIASAMNR
jgi:arginase